MVRDPNYDRYEGIVSLEDPVNRRRRRPFRVDEDGNVIYKNIAPRIGEGANPAGILSWDELDRGLAGPSAPAMGDIVATAARGSAAGRAQERIAPTRKTIGGIEYEVISANRFDPTRSNRKTAIPNADMIARMNADMDQIAVTDRRATGEKGTRIVRLPFDFSRQADDLPAGEKNLPLTNPKSDMYYSLPIINPKTRSIGNAETLNFGDPNEQPVGTVAFGHGHIDKGPLQSDGMIDAWDPSNKLHGDVISLLADDPMPMATVSEGRVGWHQLEDGRLQFMYPVGSFSDKEREKEQWMRKRIQENLDRQQSLFYRKDR